MDHATTATLRKENGVASNTIGTAHGTDKDVSKEWRPDEGIQYAPLFQPSAWRARAFVTYFFAWPGYLWPWNLIYLSVCLLIYAFFTPQISLCKELGAAWVFQVFLRNLALLWIFCGGWHLLLYQFRVNGASKKYDPNWQAAGSKKFLFGDQILENVFWSCTSGVGIWTAYEVLFMVLWARGLVPVYYDWWQSPVYSTVLLLLTPIWREFHFYWIHRMSHWKPLYKYVHYLHHKNTNPGPWSGLSMHPVEHALYFSVVLLHAFIPSHPVHLFFNAQHTALTPSAGHHGFHGPVWEDSVPTGSYFHYLHHRYFECNYGEATIPLDRWFGSFRDGRDIKESKTAGWITVLTVFFGSSISLVPLVWAASLLN